MRIALAQINSCLGDFQANTKKILDLSNEAVEKRCDLVVFPELSLLGYHPFDLLERPNVIKKQNESLNILVSQLPKGITCIFGAVTENQGRGKPYFNSAVVVSNSQIVKTCSKELLPVYDVFDDSRHFASGSIVENNFEINGKTIRLLICEDMWGWDELHSSNPIEQLQGQKTDLIINLSASPFTLGKSKQRRHFAEKTAKHLDAPLVYVNMVGGQDELIFDGESFAIDAEGKTLCNSAVFVEDLNIVDLNSKEGGSRAKPSQSIEFLHQALVLGIRDFVKKIGFKKVHLGLSGGIDSAAVACLAADAVGPQNLTCVAMPTKFISEMSFDLAEQLANNLGCRFYNLPIEGAFNSLVKTYEACFGEKQFSLMHENLQSRIRGLMMMAFSNENSSMLLTTGNKSEYATGYATLYGDMCGGLAPIGDLLKQQVYELARYYNKDHELIPETIITRPPSAELAHDQKDSDSLPDYNVLDDSVNRLVCERQSAKSEVDQWVLNQLYRSEFKRWQAPPILKVSDHAFGQGRRMPIAHKANQ